MPERPSPERPPEGPRAPLFSASEIRVAFLASLVGMVGFLILILLLASVRPQGAYQPADASEFRTLLTGAAENLDGYERVGESRARIDIDRAIELVAERGVDLPLTELGADPVAQAPADDAEGADGEVAAGPPDADGEAIYASNCASCHGQGGGGVPGAFPPLGGGHLPGLASLQGGREYLVRAVLFGLQGSIDVQGQTYNGVMPAWQQLSDAEIAAVLNHELTAWENEAALPEGFEPVATEEVAAARGEELSPAEVLELRPAPDAPPAEPTADDAGDGDAADEASAGDGGEAGEEEAAAEDEPAAAADEDPADGAAAEDGEGGADAAAADATEADGEAVYGANCVSCHGPDGQGVPGAFPPLANGHLPTLAAAEGGRDFLIRAVLYGLQGQIQADGQTYDGVMPPWGQLSDDEIAAVLNHELTAWDNGGQLPDGWEPLAPDQIAAARGEDLSPADVLELRPALE